MDRAELIKALKPFSVRCAELGRPLDNITLEEAYPGDSSTSYIVQVEAVWANGRSLWYAIDFLFDVLFETVSYKMRTKVFTIQMIRQQIVCPDREIEPIDTLMAMSFTE
ncbi:hypothetical protein SAMN05216327_105177 [Dyadobacter sp. SG02]|uniref:hypothetical protein n=1 Tax=Dyadobacter sp. SG02 TaxID=1855291 RepID=UPI0008B0BCCD|nr:hypothetical protein [Dyadobacter sp. SG02]SEI99591.1 hypothetical protein SAMN05216327_105177 [Dyadobacter sp. SG02]